MSDREKPFNGCDQTRLKRLKPHAARLVHDVGKYITRAARNITEGEIPDAVRTLLLEDLYLLDGTHRASRVFEELLAPLDPPPRAERIITCQERLARIDALETEIRKGDASAIRRAAHMAIEIQDEIKRLEREIGDLEK